MGERIRERGDETGRKKKEEYEKEEGKGNGSNLLYGLLGEVCVAPCVHLVPDLIPGDLDLEVATRVRREDGEDQVALCLLSPLAGHGDNNLKGERVIGGVVVGGEWVILAQWYERDLGREM